MSPRDPGAGDFLDCVDWETRPSATTTYDYKKGEAATLFKT